MNDVERLERLADEITTLAAHIHAATCRWLQLIAEFDRLGGIGGTGAKSLAHWVSWSCSIAPRAAREYVRVARRLAELPLINDAFARGELSYSKVRALTRVENVESEEQLLEYGRHATAAQLERIVSAYRRVSLSDANTAFERRFLELDANEDGTVSIRGRLPAEDGALLVKAIEAARELMAQDAVATQRDLPAEAKESEWQPIRDVDALALVADSFLASGARERSNGDRCQVVVHIDAETLAAPGCDGRCEIDEGTPLATETVRRLACDSSIVAMLHRGGRPLSVGRKTRAIPPAMRRALRRRDDGCQFPGCQQRHRVDAHHIEHWAHGGETKLSNLVLLCRFHHRLVHEGGFAVLRGDDGRPAFSTPEGRRLPAIPRPRRGEHTELVRRHRRRGLVVGPSTCRPLWTGEPLDLGMAVDGVLAAAPVSTTHAARAP